jgi:hypothetical protein
MTMAGDLNTRVLEFIRGVSSAMGLTLEAKVEDTPDGPRVDLEGEDGDLLLKHKAEGLLALQHVASVVSGTSCRTSSACWWTDGVPARQAPPS